MTTKLEKLTTPFGRELRRTRVAAGTTLQELGQAIGLSTVMVSEIERGRRSPPLTNRIASILARLGCSERLEEFSQLASRSRTNVKISLRGKSESEIDVILTIADRSQSGQLTADMVRRIADILSPVSSHR